MIDQTTTEEDTPSLGEIMLAAKQFEGKAFAPRPMGAFGTSANIAVKQPEYTVDDQTFYYKGAFSYFTLKDRRPVNEDLLPEAYPSSVVAHIVRCIDFVATPPDPSRLTQQVIQTMLIINTTRRR
jgi:hypothetical protein